MLESEDHTTYCRAVPSCVTATCLMCNVLCRTLFWKFAVTAASYNQEVKIWACQSWACLQTISLLPESVATQPSPSRLQLELDLSATYMVMSDIQRRVLYVMQLHQDTQADRVHVCSFSEFVLAQPYISLAILDATRRKFKRTVDDGEMDNLSHGENCTYICRIILTVGCLCVGR